MDMIEKKYESIMDRLVAGYSYPEKILENIGTSETYEQFVSKCANNVVESKNQTVLEEDEFVFMKKMVTKDLTLLKMLANK